MVQQQNIRKKLPEIRVSFHPNRVLRNRIYIKQSSSAFECFQQIWSMNTIDLYEEFFALYLDRMNRVIGYRMIGRGSSHQVIVNKSLIFALALKCSASGIILCHNHPSGNLKPSEEDIKITTEIHSVGNALDVKLLDHLILSY